MMDLSTVYLGLKLKSPLVVSSSPLTESLSTIERLEAAGAAAVVLPSIFEEQLTLENDALERDLARGTDAFAESLSYFPAYEDYRHGQDVYLAHIRRAKAACSIPILASLNGVTPGGWVRFAREIEQAGADALELNTYSLATRFSDTGTSIERELAQLDFDSGFGKTFTSVHQHPQPRSRTGCGGRGWSGSVQPLLSAGLRSRDVDGCTQASFEPPGGAIASAPLGRNSLR
jgi:hypothetical protein